MQVELRVMVLVMSFAVSHFAFAEELFGRVVGVTDGDTVTVLDGQNRQHEVRLSAIDSPETSCHQKRPSASDDACVEHGQPFGKAAKRSLSDLVYGRDVKVVLQRGESYGRAIGTIWVVGGVNANLEQVRRGMAWHYKRYAAKEQTPADYDAFDQAENSARRGRVGLWSSAGNAVAPWEYRHNNKAQ